MEALLNVAGRTLSRDVDARMETHAKDVNGRPDIGGAVGGLLTGHIELKAPDKGARPEEYKGIDLEQWKKFQNLPNLINTNGSEWTHYMTGKRKGAVNCPKVEA